VAALIDDVTRAKALGAEGRALAERYRWRTCLSPAEDLYRRYAATMV
jgi:hypothetical protein